MEPPGREGRGVLDYCVRACVGVCVRVRACACAGELYDGVGLELWIIQYSLL